MCPHTMEASATCTHARAIKNLSAAHVLCLGSVAGRLPMKMLGRYSRDARFEWIMSLPYSMGTSWISALRGGLNSRPHRPRLSCKYLGCASSNMAD